MNIRNSTELALILVVLTLMTIGGSPTLFSSLATHQEPKHDSFNEDAPRLSTRRELEMRAENTRVINGKASKEGTGMPSFSPGRPLLNVSFDNTDNDKPFYNTTDGNSRDISVKAAGAIFLLIVKLSSNSTSSVDVVIENPHDIDPNEGFTVAPGEVKWKEYESTENSRDYLYMPVVSLRIAQNTTDDPVLVQGWFTIVLLQDPPPTQNLSWEFFDIILAMIILTSALSFLKRQSNIQSPVRRRKDS